MKKIIVLLMVVFSVLSFADGEITGKRIQVRGVAKREIAPNSAKIGLVIQTENESLDKAGAENSQILERYKKLLAQTGTKYNKISSTGYSTYESYNWDTVIENKGKKEYKTKLSVEVGSISLDALKNFMSVLANEKIYSLNRNKNGTYVFYIESQEATNKIAYQNAMAKFNEIQQKLGRAGISQNLVKISGYDNKEVSLEKQVNKKKNMTSRDVVNSLIKILNTKKIGHTGTLDPFAEGLLLVGVNKGLKVVKLINYKDKEYIAKVRLGIKTDTLDITGNILEERKEDINQEEIEEVLQSFIGDYSYEVPIYSAIKVNGKKLYEYAREGKKVEIPIKDSYIYDIKLINIEENSFTFSVKVSNGTYIRALVRDISKKLNKIMTLEELTRTKIDSLLLKDAYTLEDIKNNNFKLLKINDLLNYKEVELSGYLEDKVLNGNKIKIDEKEDNILFIKEKEEIAVYTREEYDIFKVVAMIKV